MTHTNKPNQSLEALHTTETHEVVSQDQALVDLNKLLTALSDYQKKLVEQGQNTSEIDAKIYQLQQDKAVLESGNITNKQAITQRINEEMKNFNSLVHSANPEVEKNPSALQNELKAYFDKSEKHNQSVTINGTVYTIAEVIQKGWISDGKDGAATMALRDIMYQETGRSIETAKQTINVSENPQDFLKNFQQEAIVAFQKEITDSNGTIQINKFKQAFEFVSELGDLQNVEAEAWKFSWLDKNEKQVLLEHMPAVQGIVGSIMTKSIFDSGYRFAFNSGNTVVVKPKNANYTQDKQIEQALNDAIARKPGMVPILKAGLLYQDQDLLKYLQLRADSTGKNISAEAQTPEAFMEYLKNPGRGVSSSDAARAIMDSQHFFDGMNFDAHLKSVSYVPSMASALTVAMNNPDVQRALGQSGQTVMSNPQNTYSSWLSATYYNTIWNTVSEKKSWAELEKDFKERPIGTLFSEIGNIAGAGLREFTSSPSTMVGGLILLGIGRWLFGSWKASLGVFAGTLGIAGMWSRYGDINRAKTSADVNANLRTFVSDKQVDNYISQVQEWKDQDIEVIKKLKPEMYLELKKYLKDGTGNISDEAKKVLESTESKDVLQKQITDIDAKILAKANQAFNWHSNQENLVQKVFQGMTLDDAMRLANLDDQSATQMAFALLNTAINNETDPEKKAQLQEVKKQLEAEVSNNEKWGGWIKLTWEIIMYWLTGLALFHLYHKIRFNKHYARTKGFVDSIRGSWGSKNNSDTPKAQTPDNKPQTPDSPNSTPDNSTDGKANSTSSDAPKPNTSKPTQSTEVPKSGANAHNDIGDAVDNVERTINGHKITLNKVQNEAFKDMEEKFKKYPTNPTDEVKQSLRESVENFHKTLSVDAKAKLPSIKVQILDEIINWTRIPKSFDEFLKLVFAAKK